MTDDAPKIIPAGRALDDRGVLTFCNDFRIEDVRRVYFVENHRQGFVRAWHGHVKCDTFLWPVVGRWKCCAARLTSSAETAGAPLVPYHLDHGSILHVPPGWYHGTQNLTAGAVLAVFSTATIEQVRADDLRLAWDWWPGVWEERPR